MSEISTPEHRCLAYMAALPSEYFEVTTLCTLHSCTEVADRDDLTDTLQGLHDKGWLLCDGAKQAYKIHSLLQEVVMDMVEGRETDWQPLVDGLANILLVSAYDNPVDKFPMMEWADYLLDGAIDLEKIILNVLQNNLSIPYKEKGDFVKAKGLMVLSLASNLDISGEGHPSVAKRRSNLATILQDLKLYDRAIDEVLQALSISVNSLGQVHPQTKTIGNVLSGIIMEGANDGNKRCIELKKMLEAGDRSINE